MGKRQIRRGMQMTAPRRKQPPRYTPPVKYTNQQLAYFDIADLIADLEAARRDWPQPQPSEAAYIADVERQIAAKSAAFRAAYGVDPVEWGHAQGLRKGSPVEPPPQPSAPSYQWAYDKGLAAGRELGNQVTTDPDGQADIRRMSRERFGLRRWMRNATMNEYERVGESEGIRQRGGGTDWQRGFFEGLRDTVNAWAASNIHDYQRVQSPRARPARNAAAASPPQAAAPIHADVEFAVDDASGNERIFKDGKEAGAFAMQVAIARGEANLDVLVWSEQGARAYGGEDAVERYNEDPEASVFERYEVKVNFVGSVP